MKGYVTEKKEKTIRVFLKKNILHKVIQSTCFIHLLNSPRPPKKKISSSTGIVTNFLFDKIDLVVSKASSYKKINKKMASQKKKKSSAKEIYGKVLTTWKYCVAKREI